MAVGRVTCDKCVTMATERNKCAPRHHTLEQIGMEVALQNLCLGAVLYSRALALWHHSGACCMCLRVFP